MTDNGRLFDVDELSVPPGTPPPASERPAGIVVRVVPDVSGMTKEFDYLARPDQAEGLVVGDMVRIELNRRRVAGWVTALDLAWPGGYALSELLKVTSAGPAPETIELARWAAGRWNGRLTVFLDLASPPRQIRSVPTAGSPALPAPASPPGVHLVRYPPTADLAEVIDPLCRAGDTIVVCPRIEQARSIAGRLRRRGLTVRDHPRDWAGAAGRGGVVIGARSAVWARVPRLAAIVVVDEHDEALQGQANPTWHGRDVAVERARRAGVACHLLSPCPSVSALAIAERVSQPSRSAERAGWPLVEVIDRRQEEPGRSGLFSSRVVDVARRSGNVLAVLNRKGRSVMLACKMCGELARTLDGERLMIEQDGRLVQPTTGETRPVVCNHCGAATLKRLRLGVSRAAEELSVLVNEPVDELTAGSDKAKKGPTRPPTRVVVGTQAALHGLVDIDAVIFLDFDAELLAPRYRAAEQAMNLLVLAAALTGPRGQGGRIVVQTRTPDHRVLRAAVRADPARFGVEETELRRSLAMPPFGALAEISGAGATELVTGIRSDELATATATVMGPLADGRYLVRAEDPDRLSLILAGLERPRARVRVAVDPPRA